MNYKPLISEGSKNYPSLQNNNYPQNHRNFDLYKLQTESKNYQNESLLTKNEEEDGVLKLSEINFENPIKSSSSDFTFNHSQCNQMVFPDIIFNHTQFNYVKPNKSIQEFDGTQFDYVESNQCKISDIPENNPKPLNYTPKNTNNIENCSLNNSLFYGQSHFLDKNSIMTRQPLNNNIINSSFNNKVINAPIQKNLFSINQVPNNPIGNVCTQLTTHINYLKIK